MCRHSLNSYCRLCRVMQFGALEDNLHTGIVTQPQQRLGLLKRIKTIIEIDIETRILQHLKPPLCCKLPVLIEHRLFIDIYEFVPRKEYEFIGHHNGDTTTRTTFGRNVHRLLGLWIGVLTTTKQSRQRNTQKGMYSFYHNNGIYEFNK